jgi:hypothetical protein
MGGAYMRPAADINTMLRAAAGAGNDYQKDLQFRKLNKQKDIIDVTVTRGGQPLVRLQQHRFPVLQTLAALFVVLVADCTRLHAAAGYVDSLLAAYVDRGDPWNEDLHAI